MLSSSFTWFAGFEVGSGDDDARGVVVSLLSGVYYSPLTLFFTSPPWMPWLSSPLGFAFCLGCDQVRELVWLFFSGGVPL